MARRRHTPEQTIRKLREGEKLLKEGKNIDEVCKALGGVGPDLASLGGPVRRDEGCGHQTAQGVGETKPAVEEDRR